MLSSNKNIFINPLIMLETEYFDSIHACSAFHIIVIIYFWYILNSAAHYYYYFV